MINYFWIGLIVIAVFFAAYMDITGQRPYEQPPVQVLEDFEQGRAWRLRGSDLGRASFSISGEVAVGAAGGADAQSGRLDYCFDETSEIFLETDLPIEATELIPEALEVWLYGDGSGHLVQADFVDADGERFVAQMTKKITWKNAWQKSEITLSALRPLGENPAARLDYPLRLARLSLVQSRASPQLEGSLFFDNLALRYPVVLHTKEELKSETWMGVLTKSSARWAGVAVTLAIELIGIMMLWLGLMRIAQEAGLVRHLARLMKPIMRRLFPDIPPDGEAMGAILMNIAANMFGLGNAATPIGLKAMEELQKLNKNKEYASNAMCMLLAINTSGVELIPATIIGYRVAAGSHDIMKFWPLMVATTTVSTIVAVLVCKVLEKLPAFRVPPPREEAAVAEEGTGS